MVVECIQNSVRSLPRVLHRCFGALSRDEPLPLIVGKEYVVYAIAWHLGYPWYYLADEDYSFFPVWSPAPLFRVVDTRLSSCWRYGCAAAGTGETAGILLASPEWAEEPSFYERLTASAEREVQLFRRYKRVMDAEARGEDHEV